jgi:membrane carboxypeptidase/penicillin-binding protein PbpC
VEQPQRPAAAHRGQHPARPAHHFPRRTWRNADGSNGAYRPQNYDRLVHGPVSVREALANSYNIPAVLTLERIGVDTLRDLASAGGHRSFTGRYGLALTLGGGEVRLLELTAAYGIFDDGRPVAPRAILEDGERDTGDREIGDFTLHNLTIPILQSPIPPDTFPPQPPTSSPTSWPTTWRGCRPLGANSVLKLPFPAAVKTGTTTDWRDNWTVGYSTTAGGRVGGQRRQRADGRRQRRGRRRPDLA